MNTLRSVLAIGALLFLTRCDKIGNPYPKSNAVAAECSSEEILPVTEAPKRILLEDYTGHTCGNCPGAAVTAKELEEAYPEQVIVIAVHAGGFADYYPTSSKFYTDHTCETGVTWDEDFGISDNGNPNGMINREGPDGAKFLGPGEWNAEITKRLNDESQMEIHLVGSITDSICAQAFVQPLVAFDGSENLALNLVIIEDSIVDWQRNYAPPQGDASYPTADVPDYVHNHTLRTSLNGAFGTDIDLSETDTDAFLSLGYKAAIDSTWNPNTLSLVGFVYDKNSKEVLQVNKVKLKATE